MAHTDHKFEKPQLQNVLLTCATSDWNSEILRRSTGDMETYMKISTIYKCCRSLFIKYRI